MGWGVTVLPDEPAELKAGEEDAHRQREDERVEVRLDDQEPVERADHQAHQQDDDQAKPGAQLRTQPGARFGGDQPGPEQRGKAERALQRDVELSRQEDQGLRHDDHTQGRSAFGDVDEVGRREEHGVDDRAGDHQHDDHGDKRQLSEKIEDEHAHATTSGGTLGGDWSLGRRFSHRLPQTATSRPSTALIRRWRSQGAWAKWAGMRARSMTIRVVEIRRSSKSSETRRMATPWSRAPPSASSRASFEATSTPTVGLTATSTDGSGASARPTTTFCWLPPLRLDTGCARLWATIWSFPTSCCAIASRSLNETMPKRRADLLKTARGRVLPTPSWGGNPPG